MRGDGSVYLRGKRWWVVYFKDGERYREPCGTDVTLKTDPKGVRARAVLKAIHKEIRGGTFIPPDARSLTVNDLLDSLLTHQENKGRKSVRKVKSHLEAVRGELGHVKAVHLDTDMVEKYQKTRLAAGRARATVNRECEALRSAFRLAAFRTPPRIPRVPYIPMLTVQNARQGFLPRADFTALLARLPDQDVSDFIDWFWWTGMRPNEIRQLTWPMFDRETWTLDLDPQAAKIGKGRTIAIVGPLRKIIERRLRARRFDSQLIFHRTSKGKPGQPIKDYSKQWALAAKAAGLRAGRKVDGGVTPYDLRRCAVRNLIRGGTHETIAMKITGHKTRSTFDRYNIASIDDISEAMKRTAAYVKTLPTRRKVATMEQPQNRHNPGRSRKAR